MINKINFIVLFSFFCLSSIAAQQTWYENSSSTNNINFNSATAGTFTTDESNPETNGINSNITVSQFVRNGDTNPTILFDLTNPITDLSSYSISLKAKIIEHNYHLENKKTFNDFDLLVNEILNPKYETAPEFYESIIVVIIEDIVDKIINKLKQEVENLKK